MKYTFVSTNIYQSKPLLSAFWNKFTKIYIREISPDLTKAELFVPRHAFYLHRAWRSVQCKTWCGRQKTQNKIHTTQLISALLTELTAATEHTLSQGCSPSPCRGHLKVGRICLSVAALGD